MRLAFVTEYDGTNFSGFQKQKNAISVQEAIEDALKEITKQEISINYAGRTDAGVHALSQVFDFKTDIDRDHKNWIDGMNSNLPDSISIKSISNVSEDFHSRFSALDRSYTYVVYNSKTKPLFFDRLVHWDDNLIEFSIIKEQANMFLGSHDFTSFRSSRCSSKNPVKEIKIGNEILKSLNLRNKGVKIISCPSCARQAFQVIDTVKTLEEKLSHIKTPLTLSIIGCVVNGPGEAAMTDIGITGGGKGNNMLYLSGIQSEKVLSEDIISRVVSEVEKKAAELDKKL